MQDKRIKKIGWVVLLSCAIYVVFVNIGQPHWRIKTDGSDRPQVPFEIVDNVKSGGVTPLNEIRILMSSEDYSKDNLEAIFQWYLEQKINPDEVLTINVYTDKNNLLLDKQYRQRFFLAGKGGDIPTSPLPEASRWPLYDAFFRCGNGLAKEGTGVYTFAPNLKAPDETITITINKKKQM